MASPQRRRIFYLAPDFDHPSWGIGLLYGHVRLLRARGWRAYVLHYQSPFRVEWLDDTPPCRHLDEPSLDFADDDILVCPEVLAHQVAAMGFPGQAVLFVQGTYPLFASISGRQAMAELGFERAITILPHARKVLTRFFGIDATVVPPFIAPYFLDAPLDRRRARRVLLHVKPDYEKAGFLDRQIFEALWAEGPTHGWELDRFGGLGHRQVAARMADSAFLVNLNVLEAFNTTVPEAMAAGCVTLCYEAVGGRDFLVDGENAFVFPNGDIVPLIERLFALIEHEDRHRQQLASLRANARSTAERYREAATGDALDTFFRHTICADSPTAADASDDRAR